MSLGNMLYLYLSFVGVRNNNVMIIVFLNVSFSVIPILPVAISVGVTPDSYVTESSNITGTAGL